MSRWCVLVSVVSVGRYDRSISERVYKGSTWAAGSRTIDQQQTAKVVFLYLWKADGPSGTRASSTHVRFDCR